MIKAVRILMPLVITLSLMAALTPVSETPTAALDVSRLEQVGMLGRGWINDLEWSPDGQTLAVPSSAGLWLYHNLDAPLLLEGHTAPVSSVAFSPDGTVVASGSWDNTVRLWNTTTGEALTVLDDSNGDINAVAFSPDGSMVAAGGFDYQILVWSTDGSVHTVFEGYNGSVENLAFSPDSQLLVSTSRDNLIWLWDIQSGEQQNILEGQKNAPNHVKFNGENALVFTGPYHTLRRWDIEDKTETTLVQSESGSIGSLALMDDGLALYGSGDLENGSSDIHLSNLESRVTSSLLEGGDTPVSHLSISADGTRLAASSTDSVLRIWSLAADETTVTAENMMVIREHGGSINSIAFSSDNRTLVTGSGGVFDADNSIRLWNVAEQSSFMQLSEHNNPVVSIIFNADNNLLASGNENGTIYLWDAETGTRQIILAGHKGSVLSLAFNPESDLLASGGNDKTLRIWDLAARRRISLLEREGPVRSVSLDKGSSEAQTQLLDGSLNVSESRANEEYTAICTDDVNGLISSVAFSLDKQLAASGDLYGAIQIIDVNTQQALVTLNGHERWISSLAVSPDNTLLASGSYDNTVRIWDVTSGEQIAILQSHTWPVRSVAFSPDGKLLATSSEDGTVRLWSNPSAGL